MNISSDSSTKDKVTLNQAYCDLIYLLDQNYPKKSALTFVANHYTLNKKLRNILNRASLSKDMVNTIQKNLVKDYDALKGREFHIDAYNQLTTFYSLKNNDPLIICRDGVLRDIFSTLHTNDAISSTLRLLDMGAPGYLVASALRAVIAQRLVRRLCENCKSSAPAEVGQRLLLEQLSEENLQHTHFYSALGCQRCHFTGYRGRIGVFELLELDENMVTALRLDDTDGFAKAAKKSRYFKPLALAALEYAKQGITSLEEVFKLVDHFEKVKKHHDEVALKFSNSDNLNGAGLTLAPIDEQKSEAHLSPVGFIE